MNISKIAKQLNIDEQLLSDLLTVNDQSYDGLISALSSNEDDIEGGLPPSLVAYKVSQWVGTSIPENHPLVKNSKKYWDILMDLEFAGQGGTRVSRSKMTAVKELLVVLKSLIEKERYAGIYEQIQYALRLEQTPARKAAYAVDLSNHRFIAAVYDNYVVFNMGEEIRAYDYNGSKVEVNPEEIDFTMPKPIDAKKFKSIIGDELFNLLNGDDISILDLPY